MEQYCNEVAKYHFREVLPKFRKLYCVSNIFAAPKYSMLKGSNSH